VTAAPERSAVSAAIVGRDAELAAIEAWLDDARGSALLIEGEAGIGKTTLVRAAIERARAAGMEVLAARPTQAEAALSFVALGDVLEGVIEEVLDELPQPQRQALEAALLLGDPGAVDTVSSDPRAVAVAVLGALRTLARRRRVLVAMDDMQWLDAPSATALAFAGRRLPAEGTRLLLARRAGHEDMVTAELEAVESVTVGPLSAGALHRLVRKRLDVVLARPELRRLRDLSGGNPFYALELASAYRAGTVALGRGDRLPPTLDALVSRRIAALPGETRDALAAASALSRPSAELVAPSRVLQPAVSAGVIAVEKGEIRFAHPLLASAAYSTLDDARRRALHARLASLVEDEEERARHLGLSSTGPDEHVATALEQAADRAGSRGALSSAAELCERALELTPPGDHEEAHRRAQLAGRYRFFAGDAARARVLLERALEYAAPSALRSETLSALGYVLGYEGDLRGGVARLHAALEAAGDDAPRRAAAARPLALWLGWSRKRLEDALAYAELAVELTSASPQRALLAGSLSVKGFAEALLGRPTARDTLAAATEVELAAGRTPAAVTGSAAFTRAGIDVWTDRSEEGVRTFRELGEEWAQIFEGRSPQGLTLTAVGEYLVGRWPDAAHTAEEAYEAALETGQRTQLALALSARALVRAAQGLEQEGRADGTAALALADELDYGGPLTLAAWALGLLELSLERAAEAARVLGPIRERLLAAGVGEPGFVPFVPDEVEALVALGRVEEAETVLDWFEERARALDRASALAAAARCRALLAAAHGDGEGALAHLELALAEHARVARPFERARTLLVQGSIERRANRRRAARATLEEALAELERLGAALWAGRARAELARISGRASFPGDLTRSERRVAELVAEGRTNRQVAAALFVTERTVETHLTHVYAKLGIHTRTQLARRFKAS
jgi:DNA-binding CsgD family transcriptional regulator